MKSEDDPLIWIAYGELLEEMVNKAIEIGEEVKKEFGNRSEIVNSSTRPPTSSSLEDLITANRSTLSQVSGLIQAVTSAVHNSKSKLTVDHCEKPSDWKNMIVDLVRRLKADYGTPDGEPAGVTEAKNAMRKVLTNNVRSQGGVSQQTAVAKKTNAKVLIPPLLLRPTFPNHMISTLVHRAGF
ncbi:hypothetical protein HDV05_005606 [Chytridiales sp. JEL 0842]|nr:hypothetical protein HDV05_005606 [Chytridiales sp. JEL 0842]